MMNQFASTGRGQDVTVYDVNGNNVGTVDQIFTDHHARVPLPTTENDQADST
jgi:hypothetical protein